VRNECRNHLSISKGYQKYNKMKSSISISNEIRG
jgi:hypothetical protein